MKQNIKQAIIKSIEPLLTENGFCGEFPIYYKRLTDQLEIIEISKDKYEPIYRIYASYVRLNCEQTQNNINYDHFKLIDYDLDKITTFECKEIYTLKGDCGIDFYFNDVYIALGQGRVCRSISGKKPFGFRIKKRTVEEGCCKIIERLPKVFSWLESKRI